MDTETSKPQLHSSRLLRRRIFSNSFAVVYILAILALLYHHLVTIRHCKTFGSLFISLSLLLSDFVLCFMWLASQCFYINPVCREEFPENLSKFMEKKDFPALDIFICTADPGKEPPLRVANAALSVMAYDYPAEKISVYVSDDGGSELTLFALMEAAEFGRYWLPFCQENNVVERCPDSYFSSNLAMNSGNEKIKLMYERMKRRVEDVVEKGKVTDEYKPSDEQVAEAFGKWAEGFTTKDHPTVIQVLLQIVEDRDAAGNSMPNLIYVSREKNKAVPHHFKAGALNVLLRVSGIMTNAPIILTLDCDMFSNDPKTPQNTLCYFIDHSVKPNLGYVQFPQCFRGLNKADIYASEFKRMYDINPKGFDGLAGPDYFGTGTFFRRRIFFGGPSSFIPPEILELSPDHVVRKPINTQPVLELANSVAGCNYEQHTRWGSKIGFRYGSLVEDFYTGFRFHCEGWRSVFCNPRRPAFFCDMPISLIDVLTQIKRWSIGLLEVALSKYSPLTYGVRRLDLLTASCYAYYAFGPIWPIPITVYAFLPQMTLLNNISIFPKVSNPWLLLYVFLFFGAYGQDCLQFILDQSTFLRWWNDQRMWLIRGLTSDLFAILEFTSNHLGFATRGFDVTSKVVDNEQSTRYNHGVFEFGMPSPMFVPLSTAAIINLMAFVGGIWNLLRGENMEGLFGQMFIAGFGVCNCFPLYEAMILRTDKGRMPTKITVISVALACVLYAASFVVLKMYH